MKYIEIMNSRSSIRTYSSAALDSQLRAKIYSAVTAKRTGPFGSEHEFSLIDTTDDELAELGKMTSYGLIKGASLYFGGSCKPDDRSVIDYGYCFQQVIIELTALELGTCWLGGTFNRSFIAKALELSEDKIIPAVSPIGKSLDNRHFGDRLARKIAKSDRRKAPEELFFTRTQSGPLKPLMMEDTDEKTMQILNAVRFAPSASNKQPWRLVINSEGIHLFLDFDEKYNKKIRTFNIQYLDMGIALYHIKKAAEEVKPGGNFSMTAPDTAGINWRYIASWT